MSSVQAKIAVIMPVYGGAKTLRLAAESVLAQTFRDLELWIVDDGSPDESGIIADEIASRDARVHVIHKENGGCYQARLSALLMIRTPYFGFQDQDDIAHPEKYARMIKVAEEYNLDVVECGYVRSTWNDYKGKIELGNLGSVDIIEGEINLRKRVIDRYLLDVRESCFLWNKLYRNQYDFEKFDKTDGITSFEDLVFNYHFLEPVKRYGILNDPLHYYMMVPGSSTHRYTDRHTHDFKEAIRVRKERVTNFGADTNSPFMHDWVLRNAGGAIISASLTRQFTFAQKCDAIKKIMSIEDVRVAIVKRGLHSARGLLVATAGLSVPFAVFAIMTMSMLRTNKVH